MRGLRVIVTLDNAGGVAFNKRRQSRDRQLIDDLCNKSEGIIYMSTYSLPLFSEYTDRVRTVDDPIYDAPDGALVFIECRDLSAEVADIAELTVYLWNRDYPSDTKLGFTPETCGFKMSAKYEFEGSSHEKITKGIYKK